MGLLVISVDSIGAFRPWPRLSSERILGARWDFRGHRSWKCAGLLGILAVEFNLWAVFGLHCLMNLWWELFGVADTALGGWIANGARLLTITAAILLTIYRDRFWKRLTSDENAVDKAREESCGNSAADRKLANLNGQQHLFRHEPFLIWQPAR